MKQPHVLVATLALALAGCSTTTPPSRSAAVLDRKGFVSQLPTEVYVAPVNDSAEAKASLERGLNALGAVSGRFTPLPAGATAPKMKHAVPPRYPIALRRAGVQGAAEFLVLIGTDGNVEAVYCYRRTHPMFEQSAAASIAQWTFAPGHVEGRNAPMVIPQRVGFALEETPFDASHPQVRDLPPQVGPVSGPLIK